MRYLRGPLVALLAFVIAVLASSIRFSEESTAYGRVIDGGGKFSVKSYRSSYFVELTLAHFGYSSSEKANAAFDQNVAEAVEVTEITPKLDEFGKVVGRRAVVTAFNEDRTGYYACVFWTNGKSLLAITSPSLTHVLDFEKQHTVD